MTPRCPAVVPGGTAARRHLGDTRERSRRLGGKPLGGGWGQVRIVRMRGRAEVSAIFSRSGSGSLCVAEAAMSNGSSKMEACGRAVASAASESYTGRCSSSLSGLGGRYTLGLLQTPRSTEDSTGGSSGGGAGLAPFRAAGRKEPPRSGRGGRERRGLLRSGRCRSCCPRLAELRYRSLVGGRRRSAVSSW